MKVTYKVFLELEKLMESELHGGMSSPRRCLSEMQYSCVLAGAMMSHTASGVTSESLQRESSFRQSSLHVCNLEITCMYSNYHASN